jgi:hypothetical protein
MMPRLSSLLAVLALTVPTLINALDQQPFSGEPQFGINPPQPQVSATDARELLCRIDWTGESKEVREQIVQAMEVSPHVRNQPTSNCPGARTFDADRSFVLCVDNGGRHLAIITI